MKHILAAALAAFATFGAGAQLPAEHAHTSHPAPAAGEEAFGRPGEAAKAARTIAITMSDAMRFDPAQVRVKPGETVRFVLTNAGKLEHEFVLGTMKELEQHADLMKRFPGMRHEEPHMASVAPGAKAELVWQFSHAGTLYYGCLVPGHFDAGMVGKVVVAKG